MVSEASSWTEYTSEATLTESEVDLDPDDTVTVRKVTKVKRVVEVGEDGEEKVVSKVTEVVTSVTSGGETTVTKNEVNDSIFVQKPVEPPETLTLLLAFNIIDF